MLPLRRAIIPLGVSAGRTADHAPGIVTLTGQSRPGTRRAASPYRDRSPVSDADTAVDLQRNRNAR